MRVSGNRFSLGVVVGQGAGCQVLWGAGLGTRRGRNFLGCECGERSWEFGVRSGELWLRARKSFPARARSWEQRGEDGAKGETRGAWLSSLQGPTNRDAVRRCFD